MDSTDIKILGEGAWKNQKLGADYRRQWLKVHHLWKKWTAIINAVLVETKMRCFKLLGERVMAKDFDRRVAELQTSAALLNRFTYLGIAITVVMP